MPFTEKNMFFTYQCKIHKPSLHRELLDIFVEIIEADLL